MLDQNFNAIVVDEESLIDNIWRTWVAYPSFWLLYVSQDGAFINDLAASLGLVHCELVLDEWGFTLVRLARSGARCASDARHIEFENNIRLIWSGISLSDELLHFEAGLRSADDYLLASYSLAVHIIDSRSGERVAQGDVGVGPGAIVRRRSEIDISALPKGDYEVRVALYELANGRAPPLPVAWRRTKSATSTRCIASASTETPGQYSQPKTARRYVPASPVLCYLLTGNRSEIAEGIL